MVQTSVPEERVSVSPGLLVVQTLVPEERGSVSPGGSYFST